MDGRLSRTNMGNQVGEAMKPYWIDIHIKAKSDAPLRKIISYYKWNVQLEDKNIEVEQVTVKVGKEGR